MHGLASAFLPDLPLAARRFWDNVSEDFAVRTVYDYMKAKKPLDRVGDVSLLRGHADPAYLVSCFLCSSW